MYHEIKIWYKSGKTSFQTATQEEISDMQAYLREGKRAGWIKSYEVKDIEETW